METFDLLIIGAGPGGYVAAEEAVQFGKSVAVIEKNAIGGCCLNVGCIPSKTYLEYGHWLSSIEKANRFGLSVTVDNIDFPSVVQRKDQVISTLQGGIHSTFKNKGITYIEGEATFKKDMTMEVNGQEYKGKQILLATGGSPNIPPIPGLKDINYVTTDTLFDLQTLPDQFVTIGGGIIGVELAFAMKRFGSDVTIIEAAQDILLTVDEDAREVIRQKLKSMGIKVLVNASIQKMMPDHVLLSDGNHVPFDTVLLATGRKQNLEIPRAMGIQLDENDQFVHVNDDYETSKKGVYAIGDLIGGYTLAHSASAEGIRAVRNMSGKKEKPLLLSQVPRPLYTEPEISEFGMSEKEAKEAGYDVIVKSMPFSFNGRAIANADTEGFVKIITEKKYHEILGAVVVGANAADLIHQILAVHESEGTVDELARTVFAHPTVSELIQDTAVNIVKP